jgi:hypothetical protein
MNNLIFFGITLDRNQWFDFCEIKLSPVLYIFCQNKYGGLLGYHNPVSVYSIFI